MPPQDACPDRSRFRELLRDGVPEAERARLQAHLERCPGCLEALAELVTGGKSWPEQAERLVREQAAPEPALRRVMDALKSKARAEPTGDQEEADAEPPLDFLSPSDQPGHLGRLGRYEVERVIGRGGMGIVLKAFDPSLHRVVAIKVLAPHLAVSAIARKRFTREARAAAAVSHEHVVTIYEICDTNNPPYVVMQFVAGMSLQERIDADGPLGLKEVLRIGMQTAEGLAAAHKQGLVHRDVKPANILLENGVQRVKITDFGLARAVDDFGLTQSGFVAGTPQYMSPEQARGEAIDQRADLFSLGSVLYAMCTGRPPFRATTSLAVLRRVSDDQPRPIRETNPEVPGWVAAVVEKLHAKEPAERYQSAAEVAEVLGGILARVQQAAAWTPSPGAVDAAAAAGLISSLTVCPSCGSQLHVPEEHVGRQVNCPQCQKPFLVQDTSQEIRVVRAPRVAPDPRQRPPRPVRPPRRHRALVWLLGGTALLLLMCCGVAGLYFSARWESKPATLAPPTATVTSAPPYDVTAMTMVPQGASRRRDGLAWFPADASLWGSLDLEPFKGLSSSRRQVTRRDGGRTPKAPKESVLVKGLLRMLPSELREEVTDEQLGPFQIDRVSFAYTPDGHQRDGARNRLFLRVTGRWDRRRLLSALRRGLPDARIKEHPVRVDGKPVTVVTSPGMLPAIAVVGDTDLLAASYRSLPPKDATALEPIEQVLFVAAGREAGIRLDLGVSLNSILELGLGQRMQDLRSLPGGVYGQVPRGTPPPGFTLGGRPLPPLPQTIALAVTVMGTAKADYVLVFASADEATAFADWFTQIRRQAFHFLDEPPANVKIAPAERQLLTAALTGVTPLQMKHGPNQLNGSIQISMQALDALVDLLQQMTSGPGEPAIP